MKFAKCTAISFWFSLKPYKRSIDRKHIHVVIVLLKSNRCKWVKIADCTKWGKIIGQLLCDQSKSCSSLPNVWRSWKVRKLVITGGMSFCLQMVSEPTCWDLWVPWTCKLSKHANDMTSSNGFSEIALVQKSLTTICNGCRIASVKTEKMHAKGEPMKFDTQFNITFQSY